MCSNNLFSYFYNFIAASIAAGNINLPVRRLSDGPQTTKVIDQKIFRFRNFITCRI